jgi:8-oxo-dGTP pyrophosphatase MutT (NUDIX family)
MAAGENPTVRHAARVVLLDETSRVLLVRFEYRERSWWTAPGGGLEDEETHEEAARREIWEETGLDLRELGPWIWTREHVFRFEGRLYRQRERYFLAVVPAFAPRPHLLGSEEVGVLRGLRWWTLDELEATAEDLAPADLPALVRNLVAHGPPQRPREVGV